MLENNNNIPSLPDTDVLVTKNTFTEHGNEMEEIISKRLPFTVRWGTVFFLLLLLMIGFICWLIQYPDIVIAKARLNSINAPKQVIARTDGKLISIAVKQNETVQEGQVLGYMESIADPAIVARLHEQTDSIISLIEQNKTDEIVKYFPSNYSSFKRGQEGALGELQIAFQTFAESFTTFKGYLTNGFYLRKKKMLLADIINIHQLHDILNSQKSLLQKDLSLSNETFAASESLANDNVISALDYRNEKSKVIAKELSLPQINASILNNENQQNEKQKEIAELENQISLQKNIFVQSAQTLKSQVQAWEFKYLLKAPVAGTVLYAGFFQENQEIKSGQLLFNIQPANTSYFVEMLIPQYNFGKVKTDQKV
ncbi:MAG: HlyD family efflux transporter periplasmic adaptor subunit, partial [Ginsengibacter sp.]